MPTYYTVITDVGLAKIAAAHASGGSVNLTEMAVGDGNGNPVTVSQTRTALVREVYRDGLNNLLQDVSNQTIFIAELAIPEAEGGWTVREVGLFDDEGDMIAYANFPATYKPTIPEGATQDLIIQIYVQVSNSDVISVSINPLIVHATRQWVQANFLSLLGGTTGQIIRKKSNVDNDIEWVNLNLSDFNVTVIAEEEAQTLAAAQTTVTFASITTGGIAVYVEGVRLRSGIDYTITDEVSISLSQSYPDGTPILGVRNDPNGSVTPAGIGALAIDQNLNDVADKPTARANLGVPYASQAEAEAGSEAAKVLSPLTAKQQTDARLASQGEAEAGVENSKLMTPLRVKQAISVTAVPAGAVLPFAMNAVPDGWLKCNGQAVSRLTYAALFTAIGTTFGVGDGSTTFNLPEMRAEFIRGYDDGRGVDSGRAFGSSQGEEVGPHTHPIATKLVIGAGNKVPGSISSTNAGTAATDPNSGQENRPRNVAMLYCIKY